MSVSRSARVLLLAIVVIAGIGVIDAGVTSEPDLVALFIAVAVISLVLLARSLSSRRNLSVRSDLAAWIQLRADLTGEAPGHVADRAIAHYRLALGEPHNEAEASTTRSTRQ
jgi:Flp pilus assembly protein TadB